MSEVKITRPLLADHSRRTMTDAGDAAATMSSPRDGDGSVLLYNVAVTAPRIVTLDTAGAKVGQRWRVVRELAATGANTVDVGGIQDLDNAGEWCEVQYDGTAWVVVGGSTLP